MQKVSRILPGDLVQVGVVEVQPLARVDTLAISSFVRLAWLRPVGVRIGNADGSFQLLSVGDRTRWLQVGLTLIFTLIGWQLLIAFKSSH